MDEEKLDEEFDKAAKMWVEALMSGVLTEEALDEFFKKFRKVFEMEDPVQKKLYLIRCYQECLWRSILKTHD